MMDTSWGPNAFCPSVALRWSGGTTSTRSVHSHTHAAELQAWLIWGHSDQQTGLGGTILLSGPHVKKVTDNQESHNYTNSNTNANTYTY